MKIIIVSFSSERERDVLLVGARFSPPQRKQMKNVVRLEVSKQSKKKKLKVK